jgi:hypothetical protein
MSRAAGHVDGAAAEQRSYQSRAETISRVAENGSVSDARFQAATHPTPSCPNLLLPQAYTKPDTSGRRQPDFMGA